MRPTVFKTDRAGEGIQKIVQEALPSVYFKLSSVLAFYRQSKTIHMPERVKLNLQYRFPDLLTLKAKSKAKLLSDNIALFF